MSERERRERDRDQYFRGKKPKRYEYGSDDEFNQAYKKWMRDYEQLR